MSVARASGYASVTSSWNESLKCSSDRGTSSSRYTSSNLHHNKYVNTRSRDDIALRKAASPVQGRLPERHSKDPFHELKFIITAPSLSRKLFIIAVPGPVMTIST